MAAGGVASASTATANSTAKANSNPTRSIRRLSLISGFSPMFWQEEPVSAAPASARRAHAPTLAKATCYELAFAGGAHRQD